MQTNRPSPSIVRTHEGAATTNPLTPIQQLRRTLLTCMLWEDNFYESGVSVADRIKALVSACAPADVAALAIEARTVHHLRHVPLLLVRELLRTKAGRIVGDTIAEVIQRPDEIAELVSIYWQEMQGKMLPKQLRLGLARAFRKFDAYQLAKWDSADRPVRLRDVLFLCHGKPAGGRNGYGKLRRRESPIDRSALNDAERLYLDLVDGKLPVPDTWETRLSSGMDKGATFETLLREKKLGYMALLRNLRNMEQGGVPVDLITSAIIEGASKGKALPFRYIAAYGKAQSPSVKAALDTAMLASLQGMPRLTGNTMILVDVSSSMHAALGGKSESSRMDAACGIAILLRGVCDGAHVATFSNKVVSVGGEEGMKLGTAIFTSQPHGGTMMGLAISMANCVHYDRLIVITDEQTADVIPQARAGIPSYIINVAPHRNGVGYDKGYIKIDGFSEAVVAYIQALEGAR
jgi:60 kDa SS-A/Ro ribonucleoprotein